MDNDIRIITKKARELIKAVILKMLWNGNVKYNIIGTASSYLIFEPNIHINDIAFCYHKYKLWVYYNPVFVYNAREYLQHICALKLMQLMLGHSVVIYNNIKNPYVYNVLNIISLKACATLLNIPQIDIQIQYPKIKEMHTDIQLIRLSYLTSEQLCAAADTVLENAYLNNKYAISVFNYLKYDNNSIESISLVKLASYLNTLPGEVQERIYTAFKNVIKHIELKVEFVKKHNDNGEPALDELNQIDTSMLSNMTDSLLRSAIGSHNRGSADKSLLSALDANIVEKSEPFILRFKGMISGTLSSIKKATRFKPNRRFGYKYPGYKRIPKMKYVLAIDSSASVPRDDIRDAIIELATIKQFSNRIEARVLLFHTSIYKDIEDVGKVDIEKDIMKCIRIGGTNFNAVFTYLFGGKSNNAEKRAISSLDSRKTVLIFITDGECTINVPKNQIFAHTVWILSEKGTSAYIKNWDPYAEIYKFGG